MFIMPVGRSRSASRGSDSPHSRTAHRVPLRRSSLLTNRRTSAWRSRGRGVPEGVGSPRMSSRAGTPQDHRQPVGRCLEHPLPFPARPRHLGGRLRGAFGKWPRRRTRLLWGEPRGLRPSRSGPAVRLVTWVLSHCFHSSLFPPWHASCAWLLKRLCDGCRSPCRSADRALLNGWQRLAPARDRAARRGCGSSCPRAQRSPYCASP